MTNLRIAEIAVIARVARNLVLPMTALPRDVRVLGPRRLLRGPGWDVGDLGDPSPYSIRLTSGAAAVSSAMNILLSSRQD